MDNWPQMIANIFASMFVLGTMASMGLSFSFKQVFEPLSRWPLIWRSLLANFIFVPAIAFAIVKLMPLESGYPIGIALLALSAGAPIIPKLVENVKGDVPISVAVMFLLVVGTVIYLPLALPIILPEVEVDAWKIARNMSVSLLLPLFIALGIRHFFTDFAEKWQPTANTISNIGLAGAVIVMLIINWSDMTDMFGSGAILAVLALVVLAFGAGFLISYPSVSDHRFLFGFATAQRNISAAMVVASSNFSDQPKVIMVVLVGAVLMNVMLLFAANRIGKMRGSSDDA